MCMCVCVCCGCVWVRACVCAYCARVGIGRVCEREREREEERATSLNSNCDKDDLCVSDSRCPCRLPASEGPLVGHGRHHHLLRPLPTLPSRESRVPGWSEARYTFVLRPGCFLLRRWCITRRHKKQGSRGERKGGKRRRKERKGRGNGKRRVIGRFRALCRSPRLRRCVCAPPFAQQLEVGIFSPPRKSHTYTPARSSSKEGERRRLTSPVVDENPGAPLAGCLPAWHSPLALSLARGRQFVNREHTWPIAVRYMHLYEVYSNTRDFLRG